MSQQHYLLQAILERYGVPEAAVGPVSVVVDKMEKIPLEKVQSPWLPCAAVMETHCSVLCACRAEEGLQPDQHQETGQAVLLHFVASAECIDYHQFSLVAG